MKTRTEILEANYRRLVSEKIYELLVIMSPNEQMEIGAMNYQQLLYLVQRRIESELQHVVESVSDDELQI